jgi:hypothetical protein
MHKDELITEIRSLSRQYTDLFTELYLHLLEVKKHDLTPEEEMDVDFIIEDHDFDLDQINTMKKFRSL